MKSFKSYMASASGVEAWRGLCPVVVACLAGMAVVAASLSSCGRSEEEQQLLSRQERERLARENQLALKVAVMPTVDCLPLYVAKDCGLLQASGQDIRLKLFTAQMDCDTALAGGSVECAMTDLVRAERLQGKGHRPLNYLTTTAAAWQLVSSRKARINRMEQLSDKMVAMTRYSATDRLTTMALDGVKTKSQVFRIQVNDVFVRLHMLTNNEIEAAWLQEPQATEARMRGGRVLADSRKMDFAPGVLALRADAANDKRRKPQMDALVKAYNAACDSINSHGVRHYADILQKYCKADAKTVAQMPRIKFQHVAKPQQKDIDRAKR